MPHAAAAIANRFLDLARSTGASVDPMKLQKLVYFAHGWHLGLDHGALSRENAEAWRWGPVFPVLYHAAKRWGSGPIGSRLQEFEMHQGTLRWNAPVVPEGTFAQQLVDRVWEVYGGMSGIQLSQLTHATDGPWYRVWSARPGERSLVIPNEMIRDYFAGLHARAQQGS